MEDNEKKTLAALRRQMEEMRAAYETKIDALEAERAEKKAAEIDEKKMREFLKNQENYIINPCYSHQLKIINTLPFLYVWQNMFILFFKYYLLPHSCGTYI